MITNGIPIKPLFVSCHHFLDDFLQTELYCFKPNQQIIMPITPTIGEIIPQIKFSVEFADLKSNTIPNKIASILATKPILKRNRFIFNHP